MTPSATATTTAALAALVALAAFAGPVVLALAAALVALLVAAGWPALLALPSPRGTTAIVALAGLGAVAAGAAVVLAGRDALGAGPLAGLPAVAALALLAAFVHQLARRDGRPRLVESVSGTVTGQALTVLAACWVAVPTTYAGAPLAPVVLSAVVAATAVCATSWPLRVAGPLAVGAGVLAGWLAGSATVALHGAGIVPPARWAVAGVVAGAGAGLVVAAWRALSARLPTAGGLPAAFAVAAAPVALAGGGAYLVGRLLLL
ncbi:hypothetical protein [Kineococcus esterisolvens]|uniref:hypothetical protein n=1 Tax=unclassified Kineococcus TaxID=2621656 RepID=UPI003D7E532B